MYLGQTVTKVGGLFYVAAVFLIFDVLSAVIFSERAVPMQISLLEVSVL